MTLSLTVLNAYWSREINATDQRLKVKAAELEEKRLELERQNFSLTEGKERLESPKLEKLSASGRVNVLVFLRNTVARPGRPRLYFGRTERLREFEGAMSRKFRRLAIKPKSR